MIFDAGPHGGGFIILAVIGAVALIVGFAALVLL